MRGRLLVPAFALAVAAAGCTHENAPKARMAGEILAIGGVVCLIGGAAASQYISNTGPVMGAFSVTSALGIALYAIGEQTDPVPGTVPETLEHAHRRWAKILTERASGAAREGNCKRVRRLERRVAVYNREVHDFVMLRDPEIVRCLEAPPADPEAESPPPLPQDRDPVPDPAPAPGPVEP